MSDEELIEAFEQNTLRPSDFGHETHVRLTWLYLQKQSLAEALVLISRGLVRLTARLGVPDKYHETITFAYVMLVNERLEQVGRDRSWSDFIAANPDLLERNKAALLRYYDPEQLDSELARKIFVLPARSAATAA